MLHENHYHDWVEATAEPWGEPPLEEQNPGVLQDTYQELAVLKEISEEAIADGNMNPRLISGLRQIEVRMQAIAPLIGMPTHDEYGEEL